MSKKFQECAACAAKPGSPILCESCLNNRSAIDAWNRSTLPSVFKNGEYKPLTLESYPNPKKHFLVSMVKSGVRIAGYLLLLGFAGTSWFVITAVGVLVLSEVIGIIEEIV